jgi:hypothetical protein
VLYGFGLLVGVGEVVAAVQGVGVGVAEVLLVLGEGGPYASATAVKATAPPADDDLTFH